MTILSKKQQKSDDSSKNYANVTTHHLKYNMPKYARQD